MSAQAPVDSINGSSLCHLISRNTSCWAKKKRGGECFQSLKKRSTLQTCVLSSSAKQNYIWWYLPHRCSTENAITTGLIGWWSKPVSVFMQPSLGNNTLQMGIPPKIIFRERKCDLWSYILDAVDQQYITQSLYFKTYVGLWAKLQDQKSVQKTVWGRGCVHACACAMRCGVWRWARREQMHWVVFLKLQLELDPSPNELFEVVKLKIPRGRC